MTYGVREPEWDRGMYADLSRGWASLFPSPFVPDSPQGYLTLAPDPLMSKLDLPRLIGRRQGTTSCHNLPVVTN